MHASKPSSNSESSLRSRALRLLARREHTRRELAQKLGPYSEDRAGLDALLDELASRGWLSEKRVVEQLVHAKRGRYGPARIRQLLLQRGVSDDLMTPALAALKESEVGAARSIWSRKFKSHPRDATERARQVRFLQARGFSLNAAMRVVGGRDEDIDTCG